MTADWTETADRGSHELHRGRWTLVAWPDGTWEVRLCGGHVDDGMAPLPTLDNAKAAALATAAELAGPLASDESARLLSELEAYRDCLRALLPDRTALGSLALELYARPSDGLLGARAVVTMPLDGASAELALSRALRPEAERAGEALGKIVREAYAARTGRMDALERCAEALRALVVSGDETTILAAQAALAALPTEAP